MDSSKDSSRQGAHITCQKLEKKVWHHIDKGVTNIEIMPIFKKITSFCHKSPINRVAETWAS
jgi:hypothetical protein